ncbi:ethanolamine ammonia-lyase subunit EutC [Anaerosalibacter bizertensis]|uniref:Ethanolamine ammonia-lyase small subunit n=1 Tax=Anaerosalibacter bizertensis TaxID=932217 RepID=A0A9Q4AD91_9FIRM|nr:ethanolamine ammonia-lyase subunit EutC [Anaerosalibacter bizertensis]MBV1818496.1 ethanolamine ammonia-lyase subunit EutC [Bacteroidales bacterium MSK.15.36]MCB5559592.1 ethanolamine ammonia-lyase subunit EutC [Anaerosalibacter bizertensis]MCG4565531.1 ethanolamine ammonia-lyase subunit EutC [Anaerosalibacter bizertensis]MCG4582848.1 ethanolamine ammonia-lyase subunit EutC [Anaerosalibacter bizertensis]MCG4584668.1 ethanolamine ammonia-lyase subunit EutC [Anaerosalibacter bizertensis]
MVTERELKDLIEQVMSEMGVNEKDNEKQEEVLKAVLDKSGIDDEDILDITTIDLKKQLLVEGSENRDAYLKLKEYTPARVGISKAGARCKTQSLLRFRADHGVAMDAVFTYVSDDFLKDWNLLSVSTMCKDKDEYLTRPDLGRKFDDETIKLLKEECDMNAQVQIYISDGLSSTAIETNAKDTYDAIVQGLNSHGIKVGKPFFVKHGRVPAMDAIGEALNPEVVVVLIGERPGLATGESMSCYMAYKPTVGMPESNRTVVSNIHSGGTPAVEAGAHIADVIKTMLEQKASGLNLKL